jgi:hypothetical protein
VGEPLTLGYTQNISARGFLLQGRKPFPPNTALVIRLQDGKEFAGQVRWLERAPAALVYAGQMHRMGVQITTAQAAESYAAEAA